MQVQESFTQLERGDERMRDWLTAVRQQQELNRKNQEAMQEKLPG